MGEGFIFFNKDNSANFFGEKKKAQWNFPACLYFENTRKNFKSGISGDMTLISDDITSGETR